MHRITLALAGAAIGFASASANAQLFGVGGFSPSGFQSLYSINPATGAATLIGSTGLRQISDIVYSPGSNALIAHTVAGDLFTLNTTTGAASLLADGNTLVPESGLALRSSDGRLFTTIFDDLHGSNAVAATWSSIGASGLGSFDVSGLAFSGADRLFGLVSNSTLADELVEFDVNTGTATLIGITGTSSDNTAGLTFVGNQLFASDGSSLYTINTATGAASLIGAHGVAGFSGIAFIPAPGTVALATLGGAMFARRRRAR